MKLLITGASGFIGGAISDRLVGRAEIRSLTSHPAKNRFGERVRSFPYDFERPTRMEDAFRGVEVFVNSYYVRFKYGAASFDLAVDRTRELIALARAAGVRKIVHVSVSNAGERSDLPYYIKKGRIERLVRESGLDYTISSPRSSSGPATSWSTTSPSSSGASRCSRSSGVETIACSRSRSMRLPTSPLKRSTARIATRRWLLRARAIGDSSTWCAPFGRPSGAAR